MSGSDNYNCCIEPPVGRLGEVVDEEVYDEPQGLHLVFASITFNTGLCDMTIIH